MIKLFLWSGELEELQLFNEYKNSKVPSVNFTLAYNDTKNPLSGYYGRKRKKEPNIFHRCIKTKLTGTTLHIIHHDMYHL